MSNLIVAKSISKIYTAQGVETQALSNVSIEISSGEFVAIMGPSGCGKSSLLNIIGLLDRPSSGQYFFDGQELSNLGERKRARLRKQNIGFVFQNFNLIDELTVFENVELPLIYLKYAASERVRKVNTILEEMQLLHKAKHFPSQLSGGQQQRAAVARAVIAHPKLILADEPTGNLDSTHGQEVMSLLANLNNKGTTIVMVTHSAINAQYANRVISLFDGKIVSENQNANIETKYG